MRIADVLGRRSAPVPQAARVARNRWRELESAPSEGWAPQLTHTVITVTPTSLEDARSDAGRSKADVLVFTESPGGLDAALLARLLWWQHQCGYAVAVTTNPAAADGDWLAGYQRDSDFLDRAGFEAWRGAAGGTLAVARPVFVAAGGLSATAGVGWQLELAYRLAQQGTVFVADPDASEDRPPAVDVPTELQQVIPLLPERRPDWRETHAVPLIHVVVDCATAPDAAAVTVDGVLTGEYRDVAVTVVGTPAGGARSSDPRVDYVDAAPRTSAPIPFRLEIPAGCVLQPFSVRRMLNRMRESQLGLYQALVEPRSDGATRSLAIRLLRTAAMERGRVVDGDALDDTVDALFGSTWVDGARFGIRHHSDEADASVSPEDEDDEADEADESDDDED